VSTAAAAAAAAGGGGADGRVSGSQVRTTLNTEQGRGPLSCIDACVPIMQRKTGARRQVKQGR
jgi:hypothetical protein